MHGAEDREKGECKGLHTLKSRLKLSNLSLRVFSSASESMPGAKARPSLTCTVAREVLSYSPLSGFQSMEQVSVWTS